MNGSGSDSGLWVVDFDGSDGSGSEYKWCCVVVVVVCGGSGSEWKS